MSGLACETVTEWCTKRFIDVIPPTEGDVKLASQLASQNSLTVDWLADRTMRVQTNATIGIVRFDTIEIRVVPKLVGGDLGVLQMLQYASGVGALRRAASQQPIDPTGKSLIDLIAELLAQEATALIDAGLLRDYVERDETLTRWRGRLRLIDQVRRHGTRVDVLECHYEGFESDIPENRLVAAGLRAARRWCSHAEIRLHVLRTSSAFDAACDAELDVMGGLDVSAYHRRNEHYRAAHFWANLLLRRLALEKLFIEAPAPREVQTFLLDMNVLFEKFVSRLLEDALAASDQRVHRQRADSSILYDLERKRSHASVRPDLLVERPDTNEWYPIDAKYKLYDEKSLSSGDVYQTFLYAQAYKGWGDAMPVALALYPGTTGTTGFRLEVRDRFKSPVARIEGIPVDVGTALTLIHNGRAHECLSFIAARLTQGCP